MLATTAGGVARAESTSDPLFPTLLVTAYGGYSVYKSELVQSNDTSTTVGYGVGVYAGSDRNVGILLRNEQSAFAFALNKSTIALSTQDTLVRYRFGPVYASAVLASSTWLISAPPDADADGLLDQNADAAPFLDVVASGYGGNLGTSIPVGRRGDVYVDVTFSTAGKIQQHPVEDAAGVQADKEIAVGPRTDIDLGGAIGLTKAISALAGFKMRSYSLTVDSVSAKEQLNTTYLGLMAGWTF
jgi:hypothetical protein